MGKKYLDTKENTLESSILGVWTEAAKKEELSTKQKKLDVDGDGEIEGSDLAKLRKKGAKKEGNAFGMALKAAKDKGEKTFVVSGKTYEVKEESDLDEGKVTKKERDRLEDQNEHGLLALKLTQAYGTPEEVKKIKEINKRHKQKGSIEYKDQKERDAISNKYYKMAEAADLDEADAGNKEAVKKAINMVKSIMKVKKKKPEDAYSDWEKSTIFGPKLKAMVKQAVMKEEDDLDEGLGVAEDIPAMEVGTDRYREYAVGLTPGENAEFAAAQDFKVASMKEALAKVWGLDEKSLDKSSKEDYDEEDEELKPVKGSKTMTGGKVAKVDTKPKIG
jgi:hypothetical protein